MNENKGAKTCENDQKTCISKNTLVTWRLWKEKNVKYLERWMTMSESNNTTPLFFSEIRGGGGGGGRAFKLHNEGVLFSLEKTIVHQ